MHGNATLTDRPWWGRLAGWLGSPAETAEVTAKAEATAEASSAMLQEAVATVDAAPSRRVSHRQAVGRLPLHQAGLHSRRLVDALKAHGIETAGDLVGLDSLPSWARDEAATIRRAQRAIRFSGKVAGMQPWHARLLRAIHRRTPEQLAAESAEAIYRDLVRFGLSSRGQRLLGGRDLPSQKRVRQWVRSARRRVRPRAAD